MVRPLPTRPLMNRNTIATSLEEKWRCRESLDQQLQIVFPMCFAQLDVLLIHESRNRIWQRCPGRHCRAAHEDRDNWNPLDQGSLDFGANPIVGQVQPPTAVGIG